MKIIKIILISLVEIYSICNAQSFEQFNVEIEAMQIAGAPGVHSFSWGKDSTGKWLIIGGRIDGLHQRQPNSSFLAQDNNKNAYVIDPVNQSVWSASLSILPASIFEQLQSTNQNFYQVNGYLYIIGGYGYSTTANDHITYPNLTAVDVNGVVNAIINGNSTASFFRQITNQDIAITGGQLGYLDSTFYLIGGHRFDGRYNPMGPTHGPGFSQTYSSQIKKFKINDNGTSLSISNYSSVMDTVNLHRRDYNLAPQVFPSGENGFTVFTGVFKQPNDEPFLDVVNVTDTGYYVVPGFNQFLSQYHSAKIPIFDSINNTMHTLFFGGMSQYTLDSLGNLINDPDVPFVKTISRVTRFSNNTMQEVKLGIEMPTLVGSGAEFIPISDHYLYNEREILKVNKVPAQKTLIGYIYGGIESTMENIFFINDGTQSSASNVIFKVYINKSTVGVDETQLKADNVFNANVVPNPIVNNELALEFYNPSTSNVKVELLDINGKLVQNLLDNTLQMGKNKLNFKIQPVSKGIYILKLSNSAFSQTVKLSIQ